MPMATISPAPPREIQAIATSVVIILTQARLLVAKLACLEISSLPPVPICGCRPRHECSGQLCAESTAFRNRALRRRCSVRVSR